MNKNNHYIVRGTMTSDEIVSAIGDACHDDFVYTFEEMCKAINSYDSEPDAKSFGDMKKAIETHVFSLRECANDLEHILNSLS